jgi:hypothetical protein
VTATVAMSSMGPVRPWNPYIGPKPFGPEMRLPGRDRESRELVRMLAAERIVLPDFDHAVGSDAVTVG